MFCFQQTPREVSETWCKARTCFENAVKHSCRQIGKGGNRQKSQTNSYRGKTFQLNLNPGK